MLYSKGYGLEKLDKPVLLILHGLFGSSTNWHSMANRFSLNHRVYNIDLRNHGRSPWFDKHSYPAMAEDVANFIIQNKLGKVSVLGHSMGGKAAMQFALTNPALLENLIVADIAPVSYADREHAGLIQSMQGLSLENITSRKAADLALSDTVSHPGVRAFLLQNLVFNDADNLWQWRLNLAVLLSYLANIMAFPRVESPCSAPSLFVYGKSSNYVTEENKTVIAKHFPASHLAEIENAGHWLHAEQPTAFYSTCTDFLAKST